MYRLSRLQVIFKSQIQMKMLKNIQIVYYILGCIYHKVTRFTALSFTDLILKTKSGIYEKSDTKSYRSWTVISFFKQVAKLL